MPHEDRFEREPNADDCNPAPVGATWAHPRAAAQPTMANQPRFIASAHARAVHHSRVRRMIRVVRWMLLMLLGLVTLTSGIGFMAWLSLGAPRGELCESLCGNCTRSPLQNTLP